MHQGGLQWCAVFIADFGLFLHHISFDSNPGLTLKEPSRLRDRDVLGSCLYQSKEKINKKPDFGRSYRHLSFSKQPMKTGHSTLPCYIFTSSGFFQVIQYGINTQFNSIWPIDRTLSGATTPSLSGPRSDSKEMVLRIPQSPSINRTSPLDCLVSWIGQSLRCRVYYPSAEKQSMYSTVSADWATILSVTALLFQRNRTLRNVISWLII